MENPLNSIPELPEFEKIHPEHVEPALDLQLNENKQQLRNLFAENPSLTWENVIHPLEDLSVKLNRMWTLVTHLTHVFDTPELRKVYHRCLPKMTDYMTELKQNESIFQAVAALHTGASWPNLQDAQKKVIENSLRDFKLAGVHLPPAQKERMREINSDLANLNHKFEENVLDATTAWSKLITDEKELAGLPETALSQAKTYAESKNQQGWLLSLDYPSYHAVVTYADDRELRKEMYTAYNTRASDQGPHAGKWDNTQIMKAILDLRNEEASLLEFNNYAEYSLAMNKMAKSTGAVMDFLHELTHKAKPFAQREWKVLNKFAKENYGIEKLEAWDAAYFSEKFRKHKYDLSQEELRPYFPEEKVVEGLFTIINKLFGVSVHEKLEGFEKWHPDVRFFEIHDAWGQLQAGFYFDLYARSHKRGGAWMNSCNDRHVFADSQQQLPIAFVNCNFGGPTLDLPSLLTHEEVVTLFHEMGHALHHILTKVDYASVAGTNGVPWDAVEFPSQFLEHWCWQKESLQLLTSHFQTGEPIPDDLFKRLIDAKNFHAGMHMIRQLEFALFDFRLHLEYDPKNPRVQEILNEVRKEVTVIPTPSFNRFQHNFTHVFGDGYAAGYYSYKWAEVLASDAFTKFEEEGLLNSEIGKEYLSTILETGGSKDILEQFILFRGREPKIDALLKHYGIE